MAWKITFKFPSAISWRTFSRSIRARHISKESAIIELIFSYSKSVFKNSMISISFSIFWSNSVIGLETSDKLPWRSSLCIWGARLQLSCHTLMKDFSKTNRLECPVVQCVFMRRAVSQGDSAPRHTWNWSRSAFSISMDLTYSYPDCTRQQLSGEMESFFWHHQPRLRPAAPTSQLSRVMWCSG